MLAAALAGAACGPGDPPGDDPRLAAIERRLGVLEERLAAAPGAASGLQAAGMEELAERLDSRDALERLAAGQALAGRLPELRTEALLLLQSGTVRQREAVAVILSTRATQDMAPSLLAAHAVAAEPRVRVFVVKALGRTGAAEATAALVGDLAHPDEMIRVAAVEALGSLGDPRAAAPLAALAASGEGLAAELAPGALGRLGEPVAGWLAASWGEQGPRQRRAIIAALQRVEGDAITSFLAERLEDPSPLVALEAARVLGSRGSLAGRDLALQRLGSEDPAVAQAARAALDAMETAP